DDQPDAGARLGEVVGLALVLDDCVHERLLLMRHRERCEATSSQVARGGDCVVALRAPRNDIIAYCTRNPDSFASGAQQASSSLKNLFPPATSRSIVISACCVKYCSTRGEFTSLRIARLSFSAIGAGSPFGAVSQNQVLPCMSGKPDS